jgi:uncharacterized membrane protein HdeD (DUF308 family)
MNIRSRIFLGTVSSLAGVLCIGIGAATAGVPVIVVGVGLLFLGIVSYVSTCKTNEPMPDPDDILAYMSWKLRRGL